MDISIIIPVYNAERYLSKCLDSIFHQQFSGKFEVIVVDDASKDNSLKLLSNYQKHETRLHIIALAKNQKQPIARATGMNASTGNYIMHVDADDWILPNTLESLFSKCIKTDADVVVFNYHKENSKGERRLIKKIKKELVTTDKLKVKQHFLGSSWNKIVKRTLTLDMISGKVSVNTTEDLLYSAEILLRAKKICLIPESYYVYFVNVESITHTISSDQFLQNQIIILNQLQNIILAHNVNPKLINNFLNYFEKRIYCEFAESHMANKRIDHNYYKLIQEFSQYPIMNRNRLKRLKLSIKSSIICFFEVTYRFGFRKTLGIIKRSL